MADTTNELYIGDGLVFSLTAKDRDGDPHNLTGYAPYGSLKSSPTGDVVLNLAPTIPTPSNGEIRVNVATDDVPAGQYGWDIIIKKSGEKPITLFTGILKFKRRNTANP